MRIGVFIVMSAAPIGPTLGISASRRLSSFARCHAISLPCRPAKLTGDLCILPAKAGEQLPGEASAGSRSDTIRASSGSKSCRAPWRQPARTRPHSRGSCCSSRCAAARVSWSRTAGPKPSAPPAARRSLRPAQHQLRSRSAPPGRGSLRDLPQRALRSHHIRLRDIAAAAASPRAPRPGTPVPSGELRRTSQAANHPCQIGTRRGSAKVFIVTERGADRHRRWASPPAAGAECRSLDRPCRRACRSGRRGSPVDLCNTASAEGRQTAPSPASARLIIRHRPDASSGSIFVSAPRRQPARTRPHSRETVLLSCVRRPVSWSRSPASISAACCSALLAGTNAHPRPAHRLADRLRHRAASFLPRITYCLAYCGGSSITSCPKARNSRAQ